MFGGVQQNVRRKLRTTTIMTYPESAKAGEYVLREEDVSRYRSITGGLLYILMKMNSDLCEDVSLLGARVEPLC